MSLDSNSLITLIPFTIALPKNLEITIQIVENPKDLYLKTSTKSEIWGIIWPGSIILSQIIALLPSRLNIVEIGCGSGLCCAVSKHFGHRIVGLDYVAESIELTNFNCQQDVGLQFNWANDLPFINEFDLLIASDVIYLSSTFRSIIKTLQMIDSTNGCAIIVEADRPIEEFIDLCSESLNVKWFNYKNVTTQSGTIKNLNILLIYYNENDLVKLFLEMFADLKFPILSSV